MLGPCNFSRNRHHRIPVTRMSRCTPRGPSGQTLPPYLSQGDGAKTKLVFKQSTSVAMRLGYSCPNRRTIASAVLEACLGDSFLVIWLSIEPISTSYQTVWTAYGAPLHPSQTRGTRISHPSFASHTNLSACTWRSFQRIVQTHRLWDPPRPAQRFGVRGHHKVFSMPTSILQLCTTWRRKQSLGVIVIHLDHRRSLCLV